MSKSKKNTKNNSYATDKQSTNATDCKENRSESKNESNCQ